MKFKTLIYFPLFLFFVGRPSISHGQAAFFFELFYELNVLFRFEDEPRADDTEFTTYPYDLYDDGRYRPVGEEGRRTSGKAQLSILSNEIDFSGGLAQIQFSPISTITLDLNHRQLFEGSKLSEANKIGISNFTFQYNRIRKQKFNLWWDVGVSRFEEDRRTEEDWGISAGLGLTWFFRKPLSFHTSYRYHEFLQVGQGLSTFEIGVQLHLKRFFISTGYQHMGGERVSAKTWLMGSGFYFN